MATERAAKKKKKVEETMANYGLMTQRLMVLSRMNVRKFLGTRPDGDPRVDYLTEVEAFKNLAGVQLSCLFDAFSETLGKKGGDLLKKLEGVLSQQIESMEQTLAVTGWNDDGTPILDLQQHLENTKTWPR